MFELNEKYKDFPERVSEYVINGKKYIIHSRFGRNYIEVGRYVDYIFPIYNIRFIDLNDNVDTASKDTSAFDMMPIVNLFNEWHVALNFKEDKSCH